MRSECDCFGEKHNLELWTTSQPHGQRASDKIAWANEFLRLYEKESASIAARPVLRLVSKKE